MYLAVKKFHKSMRHQIPMQIYSILIGDEELRFAVNLADSTGVKLCCKAAAFKAEKPNRVAADWFKLFTLTLPAATDDVAVDELPPATLTTFFNFFS
uniref:Uncharacterized protein n=1 Tax=Romanomermis culicivorax TaxID=13658 RepID=A0A915JLH8_ROMCU